MCCCSLVRFFVALWDISCVFLSFFFYSGCIAQRGSLTTNTTIKENMRRSLSTLFFQAISDKIREVKLQREANTDKDISEIEARLRNHGFSDDAGQQSGSTSSALQDGDSSFLVCGDRRIPKKALRAPRSALFVPCSNPKALAKISSLSSADVVILDLEDSVAPAAKSSARHALVDFIASGGLTIRAKDDDDVVDETVRTAEDAERDARKGRILRRAIVRINSLSSDSKNAVLDLESILSSAAIADAIEGIAIPKVSVGDEALMKPFLHPTHTVWGFFETPQSIVDCDVICAQRWLQFAVMGLNDLSNEMGYPLGLRGPRTQHYYAMSRVVTAARANHIAPLDGVFNDPADTLGLRAEMEESRRFGFEGKTLIHPSQVAPCNEAFTPTDAEVVWARRVMQAVVGAQGGVATVDGKMVEDLHARQAQKLLQRAELAKEQQRNGLQGSSHPSEQKTAP